MVGDGGGSRAGSEVTGEPSDVCGAGIRCIKSSCHVSSAAARSACTHAYSLAQVHITGRERYTRSCHPHNHRHMYWSISPLTKAKIGTG